MEGQLKGGGVEFSFFLSSSPLSHFLRKTDLSIANRVGMASPC